MEISNHLSEAEIEELTDFLLSDKTPEECMDISTLDGFLTGVIIGPDSIQMSRWLPVVWGEAEKDEMAWESEKELERVMGLVMRLYNSVAQDFIIEPPDFNPLFMINTATAEEILR